MHLSFARQHFKGNAVGENHSKVPIFEQLCVLVRPTIYTICGVCLGIRYPIATAGGVASCQTATAAAIRSVCGMSLLQLR